ncbi:MAG TPA: hypothetical protein VGM92_04925 [Candidatus Kapabacteria bacterium]|jgi:hypothetical protein
MPSQWDFSNLDLLDLEIIFGFVQDRRNYCSQFDKNAIMALYKKHGHVKTIFVIERSMANDWLKADRWTALAELVEKYGIEKTREAIMDMNKLENHSIATVEGLLNRSIPRTRKNPHAPVEQPRRKSDPIDDGYPTQDHIYNARAASEWLKGKKANWECWPEYFDRAGKDRYGKDLVTLKPEYQ